MGHSLQHYLMHEQVNLVCNDIMVFRMLMRTFEMKKRKIVSTYQFTYPKIQKVFIINSNQRKLTYRRMRHHGQTTVQITYQFQRYQSKQRRNKPIGIAWRRIGDGFLNWNTLLCIELLSAVKNSTKLIWSNLFDSN